MIKNRKISLLAILIFSSLIILNSSCKKEQDGSTPQEDPPTEEVISENAIIIDDYNVQLMSDSTQLEAGTYEYQFTGDMPEFSTGDIIVGQTGDGYLRKVTSINIDGTNVSLETEQATLEELFEHSSMSVDIPIGQSKKSSETQMEMTEIYSAKGVSVVDGEGINLSLSDVEFKFGNDEESLALKINEGGVNIVPNLKYEHKIEWWTVERIALTSYDTEFNFENNISINGEMKELLEIDPITLFEGTTRMLVGAVVISVVHKVYVQVEPSLNVGLDYNYNSNTNYIYDIGAVYENGEFDPFFEKQWENHTVVNSTLSVQAGGQLKLSLVYEPTLYIYGIKGPYIENSGFGEVKGAISTIGARDWDLSMGFGVESKVGLKYTIFKKNVLDVSKTFKFVEPDQYVSPYDIEILEGDNQTGNLNETLPIKTKVRVRSSTGAGVQNVRVYFVPETGSGATSDEFVLSDSDGIAETEWTLGDTEAGTHELNVFVKKADGSYIKDAPVKFEATTTEATSTIIGAWRAYKFIYDYDNDEETIYVGVWHEYYLNNCPDILLTESKYNFFDIEFKQTSEVIFSVDEEIKEYTYEDLDDENCSYSSVTSEYSQDIDFTEFIFNDNGNEVTFYLEGEEEGLTAPYTISNDTLVLYLYPEETYYLERIDEIKRPSNNTHTKNTSTNSAFKRFLPGRK